MKNKFCCFVISLTLVSITSFSQDKGKISGQVFDEEKKPMPGATVYLSKDSVTIKTLQTNTDGRFIFENIKYGSYFLSITAVGYSRYISDAIVLSGLNASIESQYVVKQEANLLKSVSVTAKKPFIEQKIDRTVMNVDALVSNSGVSALEVLENAPGVIVSSEGSISLKGKSGVIIFIDDKPTYLSGLIL